MSHKSDREHQLWEEGSHPQLMENAEVFSIQVIEYPKYTACIFV